MVRVSILIAAVLSLLAGTSAIAALQVRVDRAQIAIDESFTLLVESDGNQRATPDFTPLETDFEIINQNQSTSFQFINGETSSKITWQLTLIAKRTGQLRIPPLRAGGEQSRELRVNVSAKRSNAGGGGEDVIIEVELEPGTIYVQQETIYTVRLLYAAELGGGSSLTEPVIREGDAVIERLGEDTRYTTRRDGRSYNVLERRYALYPQESGELTISPILFDGSVVIRSRNRSTDPFDILSPFNQQTRVKRARSREVALNVQPVPTQAAQPWLPARELRLEEDWSHDPATFVVGEPFTRTVTLIAEGLTSAQLPAISDGAIEAMKQYPDQPTLTDNRTASGTTGTRQEKIALIPTRAGRIILPMIEIPWWNVELGRQEVVRLPARTIDVTPAATNMAPSSPVFESAITQGGAAPTVNAHRPAGATTSERWLWLSILLGIGWFTTAIAWWFRAHHAGKRVLTEKQRHNPDLRKLAQRVEVACRNNAAPEAKEALLAWAQATWPGAIPRSLFSIAARTPPPLADALHQLDRALYGTDSTEWRGEKLLQQFRHHRPPSTAPAPAENAALRPLHP